jgi:hypothetical protein
MRLTPLHVHTPHDDHVADVFILLLVLLSASIGFFYGEFQMIRFIKLYFLIKLSWIKVYSRIMCISFLHIRYILVRVHLAADSQSTNSSVYRASLYDP